MKYILGKVDYENSGRKENEVDVEWKLENGRFSASGNVWNRRKSDILSGGQILDEIKELFPNDEKFDRIYKVWKQWHLNDMTPGSPKQMEFLARLDQPKTDHYEWAVEKLTEAGLNPDESHIHNGKPYSYGSAWLTVDIPQSVVEEVESWKND